MSLPQEVVLRSFKLLDIGYMAVMYFSLGLVLAKMMDYFYGKINVMTENAKSPSRKLTEVLGMIWLNGIVIYFMSNIASLVPFPLSGIYGYDHSKVRDFANSTVFIWSFLYYQTHFQAKVKSLYRTTQPRKPSPALSDRQLVAIRSQINQQIAQNRIQDRDTIKALYESAVSQALVRAVEQARTAEAKLQQAQAPTPIQTLDQAQVQPQVPGQPPVRL
jgi:hypothetical protein